MHWIISANSEIYDYQASFEKHSYIDWKQTANYEVGDIVYIYSIQPVGRVQYKTRVEKINMPFDEIREDREFWKDIKKYHESKDGFYSRLQLIDFIDREELSLNYLLDNGLNGAPQGPTQLVGDRADLIDYLEKYFVRTEEKYSWVPFYEELADKLYDYMDRKDELFEIIQDLRKGYQYFNYLNFENEEWWGPRNYIIDPFSVMAVMNRGLTDKNRIKVARIYTEQLDLSTPVPKQFNGIPVLNNMNSFYGDTADHHLWVLFKEALEYAESQKVTENLIQAFDQAREESGTGLAMLTIGLYWMRPDVFMPLDSLSKSYLTKEFDINVPAVHAGGETYFNFLEEIKTVTERKPFYELAYEAWKSAQPTEELSTETWLELLKDPEIFDENSKITFKTILDHKAKATCTQLANKYGRTKNFYKNNAQNFGKRVAEKTGIHVLTENGKERWWRVPFTGEDAPADVAGSFYWQLRPELAEALAEIDLSDYPLYTNDNKFVQLATYFSDLNEQSVELRFSDIEEIMGESLPKSAFAHRSYWFGPKDHVFPRTWEYNGYQLNNLSLDEQIAVFKKKTESNKQRISESYRTHENPAYTAEDFLNEVYLSKESYYTIRHLLKEKKNLILQGAPGVGKTFAARRLAYSIMGEEDDSRIEFIQFHQNYSYEDFVMGYQPDGEGFTLKDGLFIEFCEKARADEDERDYFLIIDEINRGNISKIFGELLMAIEKDYRGTAVKMAYNGKPFSVPENLYIIGMMNTADRSLALIDYALRRRFSFYEMAPGFQTDGFKKYQASLESEHFDQIIERIEALNTEIKQDPTLGEGFQIGHSYFTNQQKKTYTDGWLTRVIQYEIIPMLQEYWFDDDEKVKENQRKLMSVFDDES